MDVPWRGERRTSILPKNRIVWKLNAVITAFVSVVILVAAGVEYTFSHRPAHGSMRSVVGAAAQSVTTGIDDYLGQHDIPGLERRLASVLEGGDLYQGLHLVAHPSGRVITSAAAPDELLPASTLLPEAPACALCHSSVDGDLQTMEPRADGHQGLFFGGRRAPQQLSLLTPIVAKPSCRTAECHATGEPGQILGFLQTDYSAATLHPTSGFRGFYTLIFVALAILATSTVIQLLFQNLLQRPISELVMGTRRIADRDLEFRFRAERRDEFGVLERSFNSMTARIRAQQDALRNSAEYLNGLIENSADIIITVTPRHLIQTFNHGAEQLLGYDRAEVLGRRVEILFANPEDRKSALGRLEDTDNVRNLRTDFITKSGEVKNVLLTLTRLRDGEGNPSGTLGISKDITEELRLTKQLIRNKRFAAIGEAVTGIQHAIKNMLNALKGGSYLIQSGIRNENAKKLNDGCGMMEEGIARMTALSASLLNYARDRSLEFQMVDVRDLVAKIQDMLKHSAGEKGIAVRASLDDDLPEVSCDSQIIHTALMDLASNAIDSCAEKNYEEGEEPAILLRAFLSKDGEFFRIEVSDNGGGMSPDIQENIFKPFYSTKHKSGTGLGLALTLRAIEAHGGTIEVESELGRGATFRIGLPTNNPRDQQETSDGQEGSDN